MFNQATQESKRIVNDESNDDLTGYFKVLEEQEKTNFTSGVNQGYKYLNFLVAASAGNPAVDPSPDIDYTLGFSIRADGKYRVYGVWDGFPAIEIFIEELNTGKVELAYFRGTVDARETVKIPKDIFHLFNDYGDVEISLDKEFEGEYSDSKQPYADVQKMKILFKVED